MTGDAPTAPGSLAGSRSRCEASGRLSSWREELAFGFALLALSLGVLLLTALRGVPLETFHSGDEARFHLPLIRAFAEGGWAGGMERYTSATTPLFHMSFAALRAGLGLDVWGLRLVNALLGVLTGVVLFGWVRRRGVPGAGAWLLAGAIALAPYVFGRSLLLLTETFAFLWLVLAFLLHDRWRECDAPLDLGLSILCLCLAVLTRQQLLWLSLWFAALALRRPGIPLASKLGATAACLVPVLALLPFMVAWGGLVPPEFRALNQAESWNLRGAVFSLAVLGLLAGLLAPARLLDFARSHGRACGAAALAALALSVGVGLRFTTGGIDDGYLWRASTAFPTLLGASSLLTAFAALGCVELARAASTRQVAYLLYVGLLSAGFLVVGRNFQNYYEAPLLLVLVWQICREARPATPLDQLGRVLWLTLCVGYVALKLFPLQG